MQMKGYQALYHHELVKASPCLISFDVFESSKLFKSLCSHVEVDKLDRLFAANIHTIHTLLYIQDIANHKVELKISQDDFLKVSDNCVVDCGPQLRTSETSLIC